jgi:fatty acid desaturase
MQTYQPYRHSLIDKETLNTLYALRPLKVVAATFVSWLLIFICWLCVGLNPTNFLLIFCAILIIQTQIYSLLIIAHDGLHRRLFNSIKNNDAWNDFFILGSIGMITEINRTNHMDHHKNLATLEDPDRFKYRFLDRSNRIDFIKSIFCIQLIVTSLKNVVFANKNQFKKKSYRLRDILIIFSWQIFLLSFLTTFIGWWAYLLLWVFPCALAVFFDLIRVFCEHSELHHNDAIADVGMRLHSFKSNVFEKLFFAPHNMNCHIAHHLWPAIPFYNLPKAEKILKKELINNGNLTWRGSYLGYIFKYYFWVKCS